MLNVGGSVYVTSMCFTRRVQTCYESIQKLDYQMHDRESEFNPYVAYDVGSLISHACLSCQLILPGQVARARSREGLVAMEIYYTSGLSQQLSRLRLQHAFVISNSFRTLLPPLHNHSML